MSSGTLPPGLSLGSNGVLSGTPTTAGMFTFTVQINDNAASTVTKDLTLTVLSQFGAWQTSYFTPSELADPTVSGPDADPDHDGISNLLEFATNHNPRTADKAVLTTTKEADPGDGNIYLPGTYTRRISVQGITYHVEVSGDLAAWREGAAYVREMQVTYDGNGITQTVKAHSLTPVNSASKQLLRLRVTQP